MPTKAIHFRVWDDGIIREGNARAILEQIRAAGEKNNDEFKKMNADTYADALIEDAPYLINKSLLAALSKEPYPTKYDRALNYLASMSNSRMRILSTDNSKTKK